MGGDLQKGTFPHVFIKSWETLNYIGDMPDVSFYPKGAEGKAQSLSESEEHQTKWRTIGLRGVCEEYLEMDVMLMPQIVEAYTRTVHESFGVNPIEFMTNSQMGWMLFCSHNDEVVESPPYEDYQYFLSAVYGGRCHPLRSDFHSSELREILAGELPFDQVRDYLIDLDVNR